MKKRPEKKLPYMRSLNVFNDENQPPLFHRPLEEPAASTPTESRSSMIFRSTGGTDSSVARIVIR